MTEIVPDPAYEQDADNNKKPSQSSHGCLSRLGVEQRFHDTSIEKVDGFRPIRFNPQMRCGCDSRSCEVPIDSCILHSSFCVPSSGSRYNGLGLRGYHRRSAAFVPGKAEAVARGSVRAVACDAARKVPRAPKSHVTYGTPVASPWWGHTP